MGMPGVHRKPVVSSLRGIDVFLRSSLLIKSSSGEALGGTFDSKLFAVSWGNNRLDIFGLGTDDSLYHKVFRSRHDGLERANIDAI
jgi:hypothetical protein